MVSPINSEKEDLIINIYAQSLLKVLLLCDGSRQRVELQLLQIFLMLLYIVLDGGSKKYPTHIHNYYLITLLSSAVIIHLSFTHFNHSLVIF